MWGKIFKFVVKVILPHLATEAKMLEVLITSINDFKNCKNAEGKGEVLTGIIGQIAKDSGIKDKLKEKVKKIEKKIFAKIIK